MPITAIESVADNPPEIIIPKFIQISDITDEIRNLCAQRFGRQMTDREIWNKKFTRSGDTNALGHPYESHLHA